MNLYKIFHKLRFLLNLELLIIINYWKHFISEYYKSLIKMLYKYIFRYKRLGRHQGRPKWRWRRLSGAKVTLSHFYGFCHDVSAISWGNSAPTLVFNRVVDSQFLRYLFLESFGHQSASTHSTCLLYQAIAWTFSVLLFCDFFLNILVEILLQHEHY